MLDPKFIRENLELVKEGARKKRVEVDIDHWVELDDQRKKIQTELDQKRAEQNQASKEIGQASPEEREKLIAGVADLKKEIQKLEEKAREVKSE
jgi:seryl-tRNA synthetase